METGTGCWMVVGNFDGINGDDVAYTSWYANNPIRIRMSSGWDLSNTPVVVDPGFNVGVLALRVAPLRHLLAVGGALLRVGGVVPLFAALCCASLARASRAPNTLREASDNLTGPAARAIVCTASLPY